MKKRNRAKRHYGRKSRPTLSNLFAKTDSRKRKSFTFEQLESRFAFSATPLQYETISYSNDTPEGAAAILLRELQWQMLQAASASGTNLTALALPSDPYFPNPLDPSSPGQWHLLNIGQPVGNPDYQNIYGVPGEDINVVPAWNLGYTGAGVIVAVLDDGVQSLHPDLWGNMHPSYAFNAFNGTNNASPSLLIPSHGTAVAGLIGATWSFEEGGGNGGVGVAPGVTLVPIKILGNDPQVYGTDPIVNAFRYALMVGVDITNNSWGFAGDRQAVQINPDILQVLRDAALFGRDGLGMINVFATGNSGGTDGEPGFPFGGELDSAAYNPLINSRYVIAVTGVDHDGGYNSADGTITWYAEAGPNVLVAAPTGSNASGNNVANDTGIGSGMWTTDLVGDYGYNAAPHPITGEDPDRDFLSDTDYTSRFNGTSAAAPLVSGVIALMLEANPDLTYRDVQEILVRSARQNAQFEFAETGGGLGRTQQAWQTNQMGPFRDPDSWDNGVFSYEATRNPLADPTRIDAPYFTGELIYNPGSGNDFARQASHYELQPQMYTNGAGYTVAQGYGAYGELIGYGHGVIDAELAVIMAKDWHNLNQNIPRATEKTFTTFVSPENWNLPSAVRLNQAASWLIVPGGIGGPGGQDAYWNEYFADPPAPFDPANSDSWPRNTRGDSYIDFTVPVNQQINVEWVEVKIVINGPAEGLDYLKINLTSPNGMQSELNHYYLDPRLGTPRDLQVESEPAADGLGVTFGSTLNEGNTFVWTFATNRSWGESTNGAVIMNPYTGEPQAGPGVFDPNTGDIIHKPIRRDWELHIENWGSFDMSMGSIEIVWHGKPIAGGTLDPEWAAEGFQIPTAQRIQGFVGIDVNSDDEFSGIDPLKTNEWNNRYIQTFFGDPDAPRVGDLDRRLLDDYIDNNNNGVFDEGDVRLQEPFAANILVEAYEFTVVNGVDVVSAVPIAQFLTGADGNYYFDLVPGNYVIRATDRNADAGTFIDDPNTPSQYRQKYKDEWRITPDWFYAPDREDPTPEGAQGEILYDAVSQAPIAFRFAANEPRIPAAVLDINFLIKPNETPDNNVDISGIVYADVNENGAVDIFDSPASNMRVYVDANRNSQFDPGEQFVYTNADGSYLLTVDSSAQAVIAIGVDLQPGWVASLAGGAVKTFLTNPGDVLTNVDFFLNPPDDPTGSGLGNITGFVFSDANANGQRDLNEVGLGGVQVFIDANSNGEYDAGETTAITAPNGGYFFANVAPGTYRVDVVIAGEGTPAAIAELTTPSAGFQSVTLTAGQTKVGVAFGLKNLADKDFGDLPASYDVDGIPSHIVVPHFRLGSTISGEVMSGGVGSDDNTDDGVQVLGDGMLHAGANQIQVTVYGVGGFLSGWVDWNNNGRFDADERLSFTDTTTGEVLGIDADLGPGTHTLTIQAPTLVDGMVAARFRWGEMGATLGSQSFIGEVEDYYLPTSSSIVVPPPQPGDFNNDGNVSAADYVLWRKMMGSGGSLPNSTNPSGPVTSADYDLWTSNFGESASGSGGEAAADDAGSYVPLPTAALSAGGSGSSNAASTTTSSVESLASIAETLFVAVAYDAHSVAGSNGMAVDLSSATGSSISQNSMLLFLDKALAELDDSEEEVSYSDFNEEDGNYGEAALAAAFEDGTSWWSL